MKQLVVEGLNPKFHQLDVCDNGSIDTLRDFLKKTYGGLDVLINNAGMCILVNIMQTCPCNVHPFKTHFYIGKLGFTGVYIFSFALL